jgi:hypothetical protein
LDANDLKTFEPKERKCLHLSINRIPLSQNLNKKQYEHNINFKIQGMYALDFHGLYN